MTADTLTPARRRRERKTHRARHVGPQERFLIECRKNPVLFAAQALGVTTWEEHPDAFADQIAMFRSIFANKRTCVLSGHKTGKTFTNAVAALTFLCLYAPSKVITTAPGGRQTKELIWQEIHAIYERCERSGRPIGGTLLQTKLTYGPNHFAIGFSSRTEDQGVNFQGFSGDNILFILDEAAGVDPVVWGAAETAMQSRNSHIVATGNPFDPATQFYRAACSRYWHTMTMSSWRSPNIVAGRELVPGLASREWCEKMRDELGEDSAEYRWRVLGRFPAGSAHSMITLSSCEEARTRPRVAPGLRAIGVDVARFGDDRTVIVLMDGGHVVQTERHSGLDTVNVAGRVAELYRAHKADLVAVDDCGVGGGVTDILMRHADFNVLPVNAGERANDSEAFANLGMEMYAMLADDLKNGRISGLPDDETTEQLVNRRYSYTITQAKKLEPKAEYKKRMGRSPDEADALIICNYGRRFAGETAQYRAQVYV